MKILSLKKYSRWAIFLGFLLLILVGWRLLLIPSLYNGELKSIDALFIAVSAICVTGLSTIPFDQFTPTGHIIIAILIQIGGLGVMMFTSLLILFVVRKFSYTQTVITSEIASTLSSQEIERFIKAVFYYTFIVELTGFLILLIGFIAEQHTLKDAIYHSFFHSISAFCNAGFSTFKYNIEGQSSYIKIVLALLVICGGIGFYVIYDLADYFRNKGKLSLHSRLILTYTPILIIFGTFAIYLIEHNITFIDAFFQSVTTRTAGFNSINISEMHTGSIFLMILLMIIGVAPGSTGGGIKVNVFAIALTSVYNYIIGRHECIIGNRKITVDSIKQCFVFITMYLMVFIVSSFLLILNNIDLEKAIFEASSALGTVGLTLDLTPSLSFYSKINLICDMFMGRVGPTFFIMLFTLGKTRSVKYIEEKVILG